MFQNAVLLFLTLVGGISVTTQQALNANLRLALNSAAWSAIINYLVGFVCVVAVALFLRDPLPSLTVSARLPWWAWTGGLCGALYLVFSIFIVPQIGAATFLAFLVTGQMLASITLDHFGWLGLAQRPIDLSRVIGVALLTGGVVLIRR